mmetsp:Transcript_48598/g.126093  ORF Transcript_48598/g.126093 Transcript_48598/m.126093 type:complete len:142 (+) Transcript_48598:1269-1694(+)
MGKWGSACVFDCAFSPFGNTFGVVSTGFGQGVYMWPCRDVDTIEHKKHLLRRGRKLSKGLLAECFSTCEMQAVQEACFSSSFSPSSYRQGTPKMRPFTAQLLANLADTEEEEDNTEENEVTINEVRNKCVYRQRYLLELLS